MLTIARVTHRRYYGDRPDECVDHIEGYYTDIDKARAEVKSILGKTATVNNDFGFDVWVRPEFPKVEYLIDIIEVR